MKWYHVFFLAVMVLGLVGHYLLGINGSTVISAAFKKIFFWLYVALSGAALLVLGITQGLPAKYLLFVIPLLALIVFLKTQSLRFCKSCGSPIESVWGEKAEKCSECGAALDH